MKLCIQMSPLQNILGIDEAFKCMHEAGADQIDFGFGPWISADQIRSGEHAMIDEPIEVMYKQLDPFIEAAKKYGVEFGQTHAPFPCWLPGLDILERMTEVTKTAIKLTSYLGCKYCVVHPLHPTKAKERLSPKEEWELNKKYYTDLIPTLKEYGVICCTENMFHANEDRVYMASACSEFDVAARWVDELNAIAGEELFGFCFDTGHVNITRGNMYNALVTMGKRIKVLHVHDNMGVTDQHLCPYMGNIDWEDFIEGMRDIGYEGSFSFETFRVLRVFPDELARTCIKLIADTGRYLIKRIEE
ncbi:MAG: sugar phosphate isomerase/epimerase [Clostridia bacterium]|nr:sugar phosphate isomerase/epimerase [Clostridia bacterium]